MILGALLQGIEVSGRSYAGSWWDWLTPYTLLTGLGTVAGYALLGACWMIWKLEGEVQERAYRLWSLLLTELWARQFLDGTETCVVDIDVPDGDLEPHPRREWCRPGVVNLGYAEESWSPGRAWEGEAPATSRA